MRCWWTTNGSHEPRELAPGDLASGVRRPCVGASPGRHPDARPFLVPPRLSSPLTSPSAALIPAPYMVSATAEPAAFADFFS